MWVYFAAAEDMHGNVNIFMGTILAIILHFEYTQMMKILSHKLT